MRFLLWLVRHVGVRLREVDHDRYPPGYDLSHLTGGMRREPKSPLFAITVPV